MLVWTGVCCGGSETLTQRSEAFCDEAIDGVVVENL